MLAKAPLSLFLIVSIVRCFGQNPPTPGFAEENLFAEEIISDQDPVIIHESVIPYELLVCSPIPDANDPDKTARIAVSQVEAARDAHAHHNRILKMVTKYFNSHFTNIVRVNIEYDGEALSGKIGTYEIKTYFSREVENSIQNECRTIEYWVEDINECELNTHKCHETTSCVNTIGSYECKCVQSDYFGIENRSVL